jgi:nucleoside-diphosphate kinase
MKPQTLIILKPDAYEQKLSKKIMDRLQMKHTRIVDRFPMKRPAPSKIKKHFIPVAEEHGQDVADRNIKSYKKGPIEVLILESKIEMTPAAFIAKIRETIGATDPKNAAEGTIRSWSKDTLENAIAENRGLKNLIHASDSPESFNREKAIWFN